MNLIQIICCSENWHLKLNYKEKLRGRLTKRWTDVVANIDCGHYKWTCVILYNRGSGVIHWTPQTISAQSKDFLSISYMDFFYLYCDICIIVTFAWLELYGYTYGEMYILTD